MGVLKMRDFIYTEGLNDLINYINQYQSTSDMTMIEIGSYAGESTEIFANNFKEVITIDPHVSGYDDNHDSASSSDFNEVFEKFLERKEKFNNIRYIRNTSDNALFELNNLKVDFVYIDGWHVYEQMKKDISNYLPFINSGGFIGGHDFHPGWQGVVDAVLESIGDVDKTFKDTSWVKKI